MKDGFVQLNFRLTRFPSWDKRLAFQAYAQDMVLVDTRVPETELERATPKPYMMNLRILYGNAATWYRVTFDVHEVVDNWMHLRMMLDIDGGSIDDPKPGTLYIGEPTDMATGIVRFKEPFGPWMSPSVTEVDQAGTWMIEMRRSA